MRPGGAAFDELLIAVDIGDRVTVPAFETARAKVAVCLLNPLGNFKLYQRHVVVAAILVSAGSAPEIEGGERPAGKACLSKACLSMAQFPIFVLGRRW